MSRPKPISKMARSTMRVGGAPRGPKVRSNKSTTVGAVHELLSAPYDEENRSRINFQLLQLRPKGGGHYRGRLLTRTADGAPTIDNDAGEITATFGIGKSNGTAYSGETCRAFAVKRSDVVVLEHLEIANPNRRLITPQAPLQNFENPISAYQRAVGHSQRPSKAETPETLAERQRRLEEQRERDYALVERVQNALNVDDGFKTTNHAIHWRDVRRDPLSDILRDGLSFTFEGIEYNLEISAIEPRPGEKPKRR